MKFKLYLFLLFIANISYSQDWIKTDITDFASINFPVASELTETGRETVFSATDEFAVYLVNIRKLTDQQSSKMTSDEIPNIYQGFVQGIKDAVNAEIVSMNEITVGEIPALEVEYYAHANPELPSHRFKRIIYANQYIFSLDYWPLTDQSELSNKRKLAFFNSFSMNSIEIETTETATNDNNSDNNSNTSTAFKIGSFVGQVLFILFVIALLVGIFFLITYILKKKNNKNAVSQPEEQLQPMITKITCGKCDVKNTSDSKYCIQCGFELPGNK